LAGSICVGLDTGTTTSVLGLVELVVDDVLKHDKQNADDCWEEGDANVCLPIPFLHHSYEANQIMHSPSQLRNKNRTRCSTKN
jgi:hypothetical protein